MKFTWVLIFLPKVPDTQAEFRISKLLVTMDLKATSLIYIQALLLMKSKYKHFLHRDTWENPHYCLSTVPLGKQDNKLAANYHTHPKKHTQLALSQEVEKKNFKLPPHGLKENFKLPQQVVINFEQPPQVV